MSDLISRKDAINKFVGLNMQVYEGDTCVGTRSCLTKEEIIYAIDDIPSAEPERKNGKWIYDTERVWHDGGIYVQHHCSECRFQIIGSLYNYCPHCGADMRGEE